MQTSTDQMRYWIQAWSGHEWRWQWILDEHENQPKGFTDEEAATYWKKFLEHGGVPPKLFKGYKRVTWVSLLALPQHGLPNKDEF